jgi:4-diphosphocytidyl-2-C-methyl-D-erythritol kinase
MSSRQRPRAIRIRACAKINRSLQIIGRRSDGYHDLRTTFQSLALHDRLTFTREGQGFVIECDEPGCPTDRSNLVWRAADLLWRAAGRTGRPRGVRVRIEKRVPLQAGLGGGSSNAVAALRALQRLWGVRLAVEQLRTIAGRIGADVPYFLEGGMALGLDRGDTLFPLVDAPARFAVVVLPGFGVRTADAYRWWDALQTRPSPRTAPGPTNDLQVPVTKRHPEIGRIVKLLQEYGADGAAMTGSGSAVFGLFADRRLAERAVDAVSRPGRRVLTTRTVGRDEYRDLTRPY